MHFNWCNPRSYVGLITIYYALTNQSEDIHGAWKLKLVLVPSKVMVFNVRRTLERNLIELMDKWQLVDQLARDGFKSKREHHCYIFLKPMIDVAFARHPPPLRPSPIR
ncbi:hypothetical protein VNO78_32824 [Psophocarpus tetragonolobus]|uniref:Uncharacterized protein n=1 Tax=Psophocarpus tetragonolobus TaxID=3891 RepID=A0AAN9RPA0_PSOTE